MTYSFNVMTEELKQLASKLRVSGGAVRAQADPVGKNLFGNGAEAGRNYSAEGRQVYAGLERIATWLGNWSEASLTMADAVGATAVAVSNTDEQHAHDIKTTEVK